MGMIFGWVRIQKEPVTVRRHFTSVFSGKQTPIWSPSLGAQIPSPQVPGDATQIRFSAQIPSPQVPGDATQIRFSAQIPSPQVPGDATFDEATQVSDRSIWKRVRGSNKFLHSPEMTRLSRIINP